MVALAEGLGDALADGDAVVAVGVGVGDALLDAVGEGEEVVAVGVGEAVLVAVAVGVGDALLDAVGVGDGEEVVAVGVGEAVLVAVAVGVGDVVVAVGVGVGEVVVAGATPLPGQVCDKRIPESKPLICATVPACTILIRSSTRVYVYAPLPVCTHAPDLITNNDPSWRINTKFKLIAIAGLVGDCWKVAPLEVRTKCQAS